MVTTIDDTIRQRVREARKALDLEQEDVGAVLSLSGTGFGHYERGRSPFTAEQLLKLSKRLQKPVWWFYGLQVERSEDEDELLFLYRQCSDRDRATVLELARSLAKRGL